MAKQKQYDLMDVTLQELFLNEKQDERVQKEFEAVMAGEYAVEINMDKRQQIMADLTEYASVKSIGQLLNEFGKGEEIDAIAGEVGLPEETVKKLFEDKILVNRIPIVRFKLLLEKLDIPFREAKKAILKTVQYLKSQYEIPDDQNFSVAFKKQNPRTITGSGEKDYKSTLFENEQVVQKYLDKLEELMK